MQFRGMTLIDVVVGTALVLIIFLGLLGTLRVSVMLSSLVKSQTAATAIANNQMEYIRSLPYDSVGTVGGIPSGSIPQNSTVVQDSVSYTVRTFISYYDDPADGTDVTDSNGITTDYKRIKVSVSYSASGGTPRQVTLVSNYAPPSLETTTGGGTLQIIVVNAAGTAISGASVQIISASQGVNLTTLSDVNGNVYLPGAQPATDYQVSVTKSGYSTAQTYARDSTNQNPTPGYMTVVKNQTTTGTFAVDVLGSLVLRTYSPIATATFSDTFADTSKLASLSNVTVSNVLALTDGNTAGQAVSNTITPSNLNMWGTLNAARSAPPGTTASVQVLDGSGNLLPDTVVAGNSTGLTSFPIDLSGVSTTTYPSLALQAVFTGPGSGSPPSFSTWSLSYKIGPTPLPNVSFTLTGTKVIGSTGAGAPIYKTTASSTTDSTGTKALSLEWDSYSLAVSGYNIVDACDTPPPYAVLPGASLTKSLFLGTHTSNALLVTVADSSGNPVSGVTVTLSRPGYSGTTTSSSCAAAYFGSLSAASDYSLSLSKAGYTTATYSNVPVSGQSFYAASF